MPLSPSPSEPGVVLVSQVNNMLDGALPARDYHSVVKPAIDDLLGKEITFDILFHNSEHQATLLRYGVKKSVQVGEERTLLYYKYHTQIMGVRGQNQTLV